jgi:hypothetical protein
MHLFTVTWNGVNKTCVQPRGDQIFEDVNVGSQFGFSLAQ